jgi:hypothetical protein
MFITYSLPTTITNVLRMAWSRSYGDDSTVMKNQGGTGAARARLSSSCPAFQTHVGVPCVLRPRGR